MPLSPRTLRPSSAFSPKSIPGLALWLDGSDANSLYTTDAGAVTAVSSPTEISGCVGWYDASDAASITASGGAVSLWNDKSGANRTLRQPTSGSRPSTGTRTIAGKNVLDFDGTNAFLSYVDESGNPIYDLNIATPRAVTVFCVVAADTTNAIRDILGIQRTGKNSNDSGVYVRRHTNLSGSIEFAAGAGDSTSNDQSTKNNIRGFANASTDPIIVSLTLSASSSQYDAQLNGAGQTLTSRFGTLAASGFLSEGSGNHTLDIGVTRNSGNLIATTSRWDGAIGEIVIFNAALSSSNRARVEAYLAAKWGISGVHVPATAASDPVGAWLDKSGNGRHATQSTAANRPTISAMGSRRALRLGASGAVSRLSLGNLSAAFATAGNVFVAFQPNSDSQYTLYSTRNNDDTYANTSTSLWGTWVNTRTSVTSSRPSSGAHVANLYGTSGSFSVIEDGALIHSSSALTWEPGNDHNIGSRSASAAGQTPLDGWIGEVIAYNRALTIADRQRIERYLANRWGITLAPQVSNADAQDWINRVYANGGTVSASTASAVNTFCNAIDVAGIRDRFLRMGIFAGTGLNAALVPLYRGVAYGVGANFFTSSLANNGENFSSAAWEATGNTTKGSLVASPTGAITAQSVSYSASTPGLRFLLSSTWTANTTATFSVWVRKPSSGGATACRLTTNNTSAWNSGVSTKVTLTTDWQRISVTGNVSTGTSLYAMIGTLDASGSHDADCVGTIELWRPQLEVGIAATAWQAAQYGNTTDTNNGPFVSGDYAETGASGGINNAARAKHLDTGFATNILAVGNRHLSAYVRTWPNAQYDDFIGSENPFLQNQFCLGHQTAADAVQFAFGGNTSRISSGVISAGANWLGVESSTASGVIYRNGVSAASGSLTTASPTSASIFVFATNRAATPGATDLFGGTLSGYSIGLSMTAAQAASYNTAMQAFQTALGRNV